MAREGNLDLLAYIDHGVNIDLVNHEGQSFTMLAAYHGHAKLVTALARAGANVNPVSYTHLTLPTNREV